MEITIEVNRNDFKKFNNYIFSKSKIFKIFKYGPAILLVLYVLLTNIKNDYSHPVIMIGTQIVFMLIIYFVIMLLLKPFQGILVKRIPKEDGGALGEHKFRISDEGLWESTEYNESLFKWSGIKSIVSNKKYIFIFIDTHMGHIIPKRYFDSEEDCSLFLETLKSKINANAT